MLIEFHAIQNLAPANVNRDDTGAPKNCLFGGVRRARVSSQSWKRAVREAFRTAGLLDDEHLAVRTKRVAEAVCDRLKAMQRPPEDASLVATTLVNNVIKSDDKNGQSAYLVFLTQSELNAMAALCNEHWDTLLAFARRDSSDKEKFPIEVKNAFSKILTGQRAADLALFGRMIADWPGRNVDGACQMAHPIWFSRHFGDQRKGRSEEGERPKYTKLCL